MLGRAKGDPPRAQSFVPQLPARSAASTRGAGHPRAGNVQFSCNFESGNIGEVTQVSECEYDIKIRPDTNNNRHRLWFYFSASNITNNQQVLLNIVNFSKTKSLYREGLAPVVCSRRRPQWNRIPSSQVLYYRSPKGPSERMAYVMSFLFQFDGANDAPYYFAYSFPYTYTDLQRYLYSLERRDLPFLRREALCRTLQERRVELLTITAPEGEAGAGARPLRERKLVFLSARVHPGETPAQFIIHGVIDFLTGESPRARALRGNVVFKIAPMLNPDGVVNGNYRCSYLGFDLNRHWLTPSAWAQPEILSVKTLVTQLHEDPSVDLDFFVDIHAHSVGTNSFMYGNNIPARQKEQAPGSGSAASPTPRSTPSSPRPGEELTPTTASRRRPDGRQEIPGAPQEQDSGYQATNAPSSSSVSSSPRPQQSTPPIPASATPPPRPTTPAPASKPTAAASRHSLSESAADTAAATAATAAAVAAVTGRGRLTTPRTPTKKGNGGGAGGGGSGGRGGGDSGDSSSGGGSGSSINRSSRDGERGGRSGSSRPSSEGGGESSGGGGDGGGGGGIGAAERIVDQGGDDADADHRSGGDASVFPRMLARNAPDFSFARSRFDADPSKEGTGRRALGQLLSPDVLCFTLEVSFYASVREGVGLVPYTRTGYVELGRSLASTFFDYYGLTEGKR